MRVLICGSRDEWNAPWVYGVLAELHKQYHFTAIIEGVQRGIDEFAGHWGRRRGLEVIEFSPQRFKQCGSRAKYVVRNQAMIDEGKPDLVIAFPGGRGTADMIKRAEKAGVPIHMVPPRR